MNRDPVALSVAVLDVRPRGYPKECLQALVCAPDTTGLPLNALTVRPDIMREALACDEVRQAFPALRYTLLPQGTDVAQAKNLALTQSPSEYVLLLSSDVLVTSGCVAALREFLVHHPKAAAASALLLRENGWPRPLGHQSPRLLAQCGRPLHWWRKVRPSLRRYPSLRLERETQRRVEVLPFGCVLLRRRAWQDIGEYSEGYTFEFDEVEWAMRARRRGWRLYIVPPARAFHIAPQEMGNIPFPARLAFEESLLRCVVRTHGNTYSSLFVALRFARAVRLAIFCRAGWLLTGGCLMSLARLSRDYAQLARWFLRGQPANLSSTRECESMLRWEAELL